MMIMWTCESREVLKTLGRLVLESYVPKYLFEIGSRRHEKPYLAAYFSSLEPSPLFTCICIKCKVVRKIRYNIFHINSR